MEKCQSLPVDFSMDKKGRGFTASWQVVFVSCVPVVPLQVICWLYISYNVCNCYVRSTKIILVVFLYSNKDDC